MKKNVGNLVLVAVCTLFVGAEPVYADEGLSEKEVLQKNIKKVEEDYKQEVAVYCSEVLFDGDGPSKTSDHVMKAVDGCLGEYGVQLKDGIRGEEADEEDPDDAFYVLEMKNGVPVEDEMSEKMMQKMQEETEVFIQKGEAFYDVYELTPKGRTIVADRVKAIYGTASTSLGDKPAKPKKTLIYRKSSDDSEGGSDGKTKRLFNTVR